MENKINIAKLLKDCPRGMELDCASYDNVSFDKISEYKKAAYPIFCYITDEKGNRSGISFTENGCESKRYGAKCVIFPKGKTTWEGFVPPCKFKDGDVVSVIINKNLWYGIYQKEFNAVLYCYASYSDSTKSLYLSNANGVCLFDDIVEMRLATEEEKQELFTAIKVNGYKWNPETKTLEKLVEPKFKEIHFYKDLKDELVELGKAMNGECDFKHFYRSHNDTIREIKKENPNIHTYAITALDFSWLLDKGYKIFLHENDKCGELREGTTELTDKELRKYHDIRRIWIGGGFEDFFYK